MPITKSAKKSLKVSETKRAHNLALTKKFKKTLKGADEKNINQTISEIDKMAKRHLIAKNKAARLKSRLNKKFGSPKQIQKSNLKNQNDNPKLKKQNTTEKTKEITKKPVTKKPAVKPKKVSKK